MRTIWNINFKKTPEFVSPFLVNHRLSKPPGSGKHRTSNINLKTGKPSLPESLTEGGETRTASWRTTGHLY